MGGAIRFNLSGHSCRLLWNWARPRKSCCQSTCCAWATVHPDQASGYLHNRTMEKHWSPDLRPPNQKKDHHRIMTPFWFTSVVRYAALWRRANATLEFRWTQVDFARIRRYPHGIPTFILFKGHDCMVWLQFHLPFPLFKQLISMRPRPSSSLAALTYRPVITSFVFNTTKKWFAWAGRRRDKNCSQSDSSQPRVSLQVSTGPCWRAILPEALLPEGLRKPAPTPQPLLRWQRNQDHLPMETLLCT